jgi:hypothetical protein
VAGLDRDELDVDLGGLSQRAQIARVGGEDVVAVGGQVGESPRMNAAWPAL